ncbi:hypothetical protein [Maricaulis sp.]|uniref:hypothetical protein n=1 Tax=Maricaulis sp. TaxID=1486257 RepID=UPI003A91BA8F
MNPLVLFLPVYRASVTAYLLGLVALALLDAMRLQFGLIVIPSWAALLAIWFFVYSLHANRRRHAGREPALAILPVLVAVLAKGAAAVGGIFPGLVAAMTDFAERNGVDTSDQQAFAYAINQPGFQQAFQEDLQARPETLDALMAGMAWPSWFGFWLVIGLFAIWFARMRRPAPPAAA